MAEAQRKLTAEEQLQEDIGSFAADPLGYCFYAWEWDTDKSLQVCLTPEPWASRFNSKWGLDKWQCEFMERLGEEIRERGFDPLKPRTVRPIETAVGSGHGIGKSALVGMLNSFIQDTRPGAVGTVTANTGPQLFSKTWAQLKKWKSKAITSHWWIIQEARIRSRFHSGVCNALTWKKETSEAFAGQHEATSTSYYINDEASAIHGSIFEVQWGGLSDGEPFRFNFGNRTRNVGYFHECFRKLRHRHAIVMQIDSRESQITNKETIQQLIDDYGEDSDIVKVRVRGMEPSLGEDQLIPTDLVTRGMTREIPRIEDLAPVVMSIDVARSPLGDESVIAIRRGKDFRTFGLRAYRGLDTMELSAKAAEWVEQIRVLNLNVAVIFVDGGGVGGGVIDRLRQLGYPVTEVNFGGNADRKDRYRRKDAEMWDRCKSWLASGGALPQDDTLAEQLTTRPYGWTDDMRMYLWPKDKIKEELGVESPDRADAICLSFAYPVHPRDPRDMHKAGRCVTDDDVDRHAT